MLLALSTIVALGAIPEHLVKELPGAPLPLMEIYSGYLNVSSSKFLHYMFVPSLRDHSKDPVLLWLNGGPGSSSLEGLFTELGPYTTNDASFVHGNTTPLVLSRNNHTWNEVANVVYLETPAGVGFSYCKDKTPCAFTDHSQADDNFAFLQEFFHAYPEFSGNDFYVTGESYGGVYIPTLAKLIDESNTNSTNSAPHINLRGFAIGNPSFRWGTSEDTRLDLSPPSVHSREYVHSKFFNGHGQISDTLLDTLTSTCNFTDEKLHGTGHRSKACTAAVTDMDAQVGGYNV
jgi:carboxypeptidase C (cathepsin A)